MQFDNSYFQDEIREGYYIPGMIKRSWAMQLEVLEVVAGICDKHNIKWFADCGTLLGAVRHRGFIPWDDDLDICMLQNDYIRFNEIAKKELPAGYKVLNLDTEAEYDNFITRIAASDSINIGNEYLMSHHGFPYSTGIDIFPLNYLYSDEEKEAARWETARTIWNLTDNVINKKERRSEKEIRKYVSEITGYSLDVSLSVEAGLLRVLEKLFRECDSEASGKATLMPFYLKNKNRKCLLEWYENIITLPYENGYIKVPAAYDKILKTEYGNWHIINRLGGYHDYPAHSGQERILLKNSKTAPYLYVYNGIDNALKDARREHSAAADGKKTLITSLGTLHTHIFSLIDKGRIDEATSILEKCQEIAITVGTAIDKEQGEGTPTVKHLEDYCELIYNIHTQLMVGEAINGHQEGNRFAKLYDLIKASYDNDIRRRREILFVPVYAKDWHYLNPLYETYKSEELTDVYVMPAIFAERSDDGGMLTEKSDYDSFPNHLPLVRPKAFDLNRHHPDAIIIQNPFDEYESGFTVHPFFYAANLYKYTEKLIYCQSFSLDDIEEKDGKALINAEKYVVTPGVVLSEEIYVPNDNMKSVYVKLLGSLPGNSGAEWDDKIKILHVSEQKRETLAETPDGVSDRTTDKASINTTAKRKPFLLFHVSDGDYTSYKNVFEKIRHSIETFADAKERLDIVWVEETKTSDNIRQVSKKLYEEYEAIKKNYTDSGIGTITQLKDVINLIPDASGYYGSAGYLMNLCVRAGIPTMVWDIS